MPHKVLIIDDDTTLLESLARGLMSSPYDIHTEEDPARGLQTLSQGDYAVVLSDMRMSGLDGVELLHRALLIAPDTTRMMLTGHGDLDTAMNAVNHAGIFKFLTKPCPLPELKEALQKAVEAHEEAVSSRRNREQNMLDDMTGLPNRILLRDRLRMATARSTRGYGLTGVIFMDLDGFKNVNDTHGHMAGDEVLREAARRFSDCLRASDTCARFGGDEFVVLLQDIQSADDAMTVAQRLQESLTRPFIIGNGLGVDVGASMGISLHPEHTSSVNRLVEYADRAMYAAKRRGGGIMLHSVKEQ